MYIRNRQNTVHISLNSRLGYGINMHPSDEERRWKEEMKRYFNLKSGNNTFYDNSRLMKSSS